MSADRLMGGLVEKVYLVDLRQEQYNYGVDRERWTFCVTCLRNMALPVAVEQRITTTW